VLVERAEAPERNVLDLAEDGMTGINVSSSFLSLAS
jgi:hypothetical protein